MSFTEILDALPNTKLKGYNVSVESVGVILETKAISVNKVNHFGVDCLSLLIFNSDVSVLCCDSHRPLVPGWYGVVRTYLMSSQVHTERISVQYPTNL